MNAPNDDIQIPDLTSSAMLVYVKISVWSARKLDKKQTQKTIKDAKASSDAARVNKHLLANADAKLKEVQRKANQIRDYIDSNTLPWDNAGNRLVTNARALTLVGEVYNLKKEFDACVDEFVQEYPVLRAEAVGNLGDMGDDTDYPQPDVVRKKFSMELSFSPIATGFGDIRVGMSQEQAQKWQSHFEGNVKKQVNAAIRNAYERLRENLQRYSDTLQPRDSDPEKMKIFRDTMVSNLRDAVDLVASVDVFGDPALAQLNRSIKAEIACFDPEQLRSSPATAITVKQNVDDILARMQSHMGE